MTSMTYAPGPTSAKLGLDSSPASSINTSFHSFLRAQLVKNPPARQETPVRFLGREDSLEKDRLPTSVFMGLPGGSDDKESACNAGDLGLIPGLGRSPGEGKGYPLQCSGLEKSMDYSPWGRKESDTTE